MDEWNEKNLPYLNDTVSQQVQEMSTDVHVLSDYITGLFSYWSKIHV